MTPFLLAFLAPTGHAEAPPEPPPPPAAGTLAIDARQPAEILVNGVQLARLHFPCEVKFQVQTGPSQLRVYTNGLPTDVPIDIREDEVTRVLVGRTGISMTTERPAAPAAEGPVPVEFRVVGGAGAQVRLDAGRHAVQAGTNVTLDLQPGPHPLSVRSADGTAIWATGTLQVHGGPVVVQIAEGRMPEVSGGASFQAGGG